MSITAKNLLMYDECDYIDSGVLNHMLPVIGVMRKSLNTFSTAGIFSHYNFSKCFVLVT